MTTFASALTDTVADAPLNSNKQTNNKQQTKLTGLSEVVERSVGLDEHGEESL